MYTALNNLRRAAQRLDRAAATATYKESFPRADLIRCIADVNAAAEIVRKKAGITCDEIAEVEDAKIERWRRRIENGI